MDLKRKFVGGAVLKDAGLGSRQIRVVVSTPSPDRVKDVMIPHGCRIDAYRANPIVLADHNRMAPIGTAEIEIGEDAVKALITFAPAGASAKADEYCMLAKADPPVLNAVSPGFLELKRSPRKGGGWLIEEWELLELSLVSVPANAEAIVTERALAEKADPNWKCGASRNLAIDDKSDWDGDAAAESIFDHAGFGGDDPDPSFARKGFLVYDATAPKEKGSYKLPFGKVVDGRLTAVASGLRAAASRLPQTDIPDDVADKARAVIDHYEGKMADKGFAAIRTKALGAFRQKDMYDVSWFASVLQALVSLAIGAEWERDYEGDDSVVPEMLAEVVRGAAEAYAAMSAEEVAELLAALPGASDAQKAHVAEATGLKALLRYGELAGKLKAGAEFSGKNRKAMRDACKAIMQGHDAIIALVGDDEAGEAGDTPEDDADEDKAAPALTQRQREIEVLRLKGAA